MRVIAGSKRSLPLKTPAGMETRPTTDRIKETLFNMLMPRISDSIFIDLFSGSGGIGIEALSRGAQKAYFIDNHKNAITCIKSNLNFTRLQPQSVVLQQDFSLALRNIHEKQADIIFIDPPYKEGMEQAVFSVLADLPYITTDTWIILEAQRNLCLDFFDSDLFVIIKQKLYKTNQHIFFKKKK